MVFLHKIDTYNFVVLNFFCSMENVQYNRNSAEYEYVIENAKIQAIPKKLLEVPQVHHNATKSKYQQHQRSFKNDIDDIAITQLSEDSRNFKPQNESKSPQCIPETLKQVLMVTTKQEEHPCGPCDPANPKYNPCHKSRVSEEQPCSTCRKGLFSSSPCRSLTEEDAQEIINKPLYNKVQPPLADIKTVKDKVSKPKKLDKKDGQHSHKSGCWCCLRRKSKHKDEYPTDVSKNGCIQYEYVIENSRIYRVPVQLLNMHQAIESIETNQPETVPLANNEEIHLDSESKKKEPLGAWHQPFVHQPPKPVFMAANKSKPHVPKVCGPCHPLDPNYNPCDRKFIPEERPCAACRTDLFPNICRPLTEEDAQEIINKPLYEKAHTPMEILKDLASTSADSIEVRRPQRNNDENIPAEIKQVIDTLKIIKPENVKLNKKPPADDITTIKSILKRTPSNTRPANPHISGDSMMVKPVVKPEDFSGIDHFTPTIKDEVVLPCYRPTNNIKSDEYTETDDEEAKKQSKLKWKIVISKHRTCDGCNCSET